MTFREQYMNREIEFDGIFDLTDEWGFSDDNTQTLREFLGLTGKEEDLWISDSDEALEEFMEQERNMKLLFLDLDGTLLNDDKEITKGNMNAINRALKSGHKIVIATGRPLASAIVLSRELGLSRKGFYAIAFNGAAIYDLYRKKLIFSKTLPFKHVRYLFDAAHSAGLHCHTYDATHILSEHDTPALHTYEKRTNLPSLVVPDVLTQLTDEPGKVLVINYEDKVPLIEFRKSIAEWSKGRVDSVFSCPSYLELVAPEISKGNAMGILCEHLGISINNTIAAGDAENDITMLQTTKIAAVMANADDDIKAYASYVTQKDNNHDGVAEIIEKFMLSTPI